VRNNILTILQQASAIGVVTVGMTFVIIGGGIDLSVGAIIALAGVWATTLATQSHGAIGVIFTALVVGIAVGLINGVLISYGRLVPHRWSAAFDNLGVQDREAAVRICPVRRLGGSDVAAQFHFEVRACDAAEGTLSSMVAVLNMKIGCNRSTHA